MNRVGIDTMAMVSQLNLQSSAGHIWAYLIPFSIPSIRLC